MYISKNVIEFTCESVLETRKIGGPDFQLLLLLLHLRASWEPLGQTVFVWPSSLRLT